MNYKHDIIRKTLHEYLAKNHRHTEFLARLKSGDIAGILKSFKDLPSVLREVFTLALHLENKAQVEELDLVGMVSSILPSQKTIDELPDPRSETQIEYEALLTEDAKRCFVLNLWAIENETAVYAYLADRDSKYLESVEAEIEPGAQFAIEFGTKIHSAAKQLAIVEFFGGDIKACNDANFGRDEDEALDNVIQGFSLEPGLLNRAIKRNLLSEYADFQEEVQDVLVALRDAALKPECAYTQKVKYLMLDNFFDNQISDFHQRDTFYMTYLARLDATWALARKTFPNLATWFPSCIENNERIIKSFEEFRKTGLIAGRRLGDL